MLRFLLSVALSIPVFAGPNARGGARMDLVALQAKMSMFLTLNDETQTGFQQLRTLLEQHRTLAAQVVAGGLRLRLRQALEHWQDLETCWQSAGGSQRGTLLRLAERSDWVAPELLNYMRLRTRFAADDTRLQLQIWRGLSRGQMLHEASTIIDTTHDYSGFMARPGAFVVINTVDGGLLQGRFLGWTHDDQMVLRETLPASVIPLQVQRGRIRQVPMPSVAALLLVPHPGLQSESAPAPPALNSNGRFNPAFFGDDSIYEIVLRPDDLQLLRLAEAETGPVSLPRPTIRQIDPRAEPATHFSAAFFQDCEFALAAEGVPGQ